MCGSPYFLTVRDELARCQVPERAVRPLLVVVEAPGFDLLPRVLERDELMHVQALVAQAPVEGGLASAAATLEPAQPPYPLPIHQPALRRNRPRSASSRTAAVARELADAHAQGGLVLGAALPIPGGATGLVDLYVRGLIPTLPRAGRGICSTPPAAGPPPPPRSTNGP